MSQIGQHFTHPAYGIVPGIIAIALGLIAVVHPDRNGTGGPGVAGLLGIPLWGLGAACITIGAFFLVMGIRQAVLARRSR